MHNTRRKVLIKQWCNVGRVPISIGRQLSYEYDTTALNLKLVPNYKAPVNYQNHPLTSKADWVVMTGLMLDVEIKESLDTTIPHTVRVSLKRQ